MTLSDNYIQRLRNLAGIEAINEADNRSIITDKIKLPKTIADWAHGLSDKYSIWIANTFKTQYLAGDRRLFRGMPDAAKQEIIRQVEAGRPNATVLKDMNQMAQSLNGNYHYILDWLRGRNAPPVRETDPIDFKTLTFEEAMDRSNVWHNELKKLQGGAVQDEDGTVVMTFPDGYYWINLGKARCEKEAQAMGHCGSGRGILYSLRREKHPYVTVDLVNGVIGQIKGRANTKPKAEFHKYIIPFLLDRNIGVTHLQSSYQPHTDFQLTDLTDEQINDIVRKKPILLTSSEAVTRRLNPETLAFVLDYMLKNHPDFFKRYWLGYLDKETGHTSAPKLVEYILATHLAWFSEGPNGRKEITVDEWPFTESQKDFLVEKQIEGDIDILESTKLDKLHLTKEQITKLVKEVPEIFDPEFQDFKALGITAKGIEHIIESSPETIPEHKVEELLTTEEMKDLFKNNPTWTDAVYLVAKYLGYNGVKKLKPSTGGGFKPDYVEVLYDDWTDETLIGLFDNKEAVKQIANWDLHDYGGYNYKYDDVDHHINDLNNENIAYIVFLLKKAFTSQKKGLYDQDKMRIRHAIMAMTKKEIAQLMSDPDAFVEKYKIQEYDDAIVDDIKDVVENSVEDAQRNADEGEYWKLFTGPVEEFLGKSEFKDAKVKRFNKETGKNEMLNTQVLKFKMPYDEFLRLLKDYEYHNSSDNSYSIRLKDGSISPPDIIKFALNESGDVLKFKEPYYGVNGDIDNEGLNERFSDLLHEKFSEQLEKAKVVVKKKKKAD